MAWRLERRRVAPTVPALRRVARATRQGYGRENAKDKKWDEVISEGEAHPPDFYPDYVEMESVPTSGWRRHISAKGDKAKAMAELERLFEKSADAILKAAEAACRTLQLEQGKKKEAAATALDRLNLIYRGR